MSSTLTTPDSEHTSDASTRPPEYTPLAGWLAAVLVLLSSGAVLVLEIASLRLVAPYIGLTMEANTLIIGVALAAIAVGTRVGGLLADRRVPRTLLGPSFLIGGVSVLLIAPLLRSAAQWLEGGALSLAWLYVIVGGLLFLPAAVLSIVTPVVIKVQLGELSRTGDIVGQLSSLGTWGAIIATFLTGFGFLLVVAVDTLLIGVGAVLMCTGLALCVVWLRTGTTSVAGVLLLVSVGVVSGHTLAPNTCEYETAYHCVEIRTLDGHEDRKLLLLDGLRHSVVDLKDPTHLEFRYAQTVASVADVILPAEQRSNVAVLGAGALTLPRYLAATQPDSHSTVFEIDEGVAKIARTQFGEVDPSITLQVSDARLGMRDTPSEEKYNLIVGDAFGGVSVPWHLTTQEFFTELQEKLTPQGVYAMNIIDGGEHRLLEAEVATLATVFQHVAVFVETLDPSGGNFVVLASDAELPLTQITTRNQQRDTEAEPLTLLSSQRTQKMIEEGRVFTDTFAPADQYLTR